MEYPPLQSPPPNPESLLQLQPVPTLLERIKAELSAEFHSALPIRFSRAPGRLDVMGGIAEYTGSLLIQQTLSNAAAVALQPRNDRLIQIFSFNLFDEHKPFTFGIPLDSLAKFPIATLRAELAQPGRIWAAHLVGCFAMLHQANLIDLTDPKHRGVNLALYSTIPSAAGLASSAAIQAATMMNLLDHFQIRPLLDPLRFAHLCHAVQTDLAGTSSGIAAHITTCSGQSHSLVRLLCQPHEIQKPLSLPPNTRVFGIDSTIRRNPINNNYHKTRRAAFIAHQMILQKMKDIGREMGHPLRDDPMHGYLANLDPDDYKKLFRPSLPQNMSGQQFLDQFASAIDAQIQISPIEWYPIQHAADHHVLEARRVKNFAEFLEQAANSQGTDRKKLLDKAGHLMYASHLSYTNDAMLGCEECDLLIQLVRERERAGFYGARITSAGAGGTVAVLAEQSESTNTAIADILTVYENRTGKKPQIIQGSSPGAWHVGTALV